MLPLPPFVAVWLWVAIISYALFRKTITPIHWCNSRGVKISITWNFGFFFLPDCMPLQSCHLVPVPSPPPPSIILRVLCLTVLFCWGFCPFCCLVSAFVGSPPLPPAPFLGLCVLSLVLLFWHVVICFTFLSLSTYYLIERNIK